MLSMMLVTSWGGISWRMEFSTRSQSRAVSSMRVPVGARRCRVNWPLSTLGKKSWPIQGTSRNEAAAAPKTPTASQARWSQASPQPTLVPPPQPFEGVLKSYLQARQKVALGLGLQIRRVVLVAAEQVPRHGRHQGPGQEVRRQHGEAHRFRQGDKEVPGDPGQEKHGHENNADGEGRDKSRNGNLRRAIQNRQSESLYPWRCCG